MKKLVLAAVCAEVLMGVFASSAAATGWSANPGQADRNQDGVVCSSEKRLDRARPFDADNRPNGSCRPNTMITYII